MRQLRFSLGRCGLVGLVLLVAKVAAALPASAFDVAPPQAWVDELPIPPLPAKSDSGGIDRLLEDTQLLVRGRDSERYRHRAWRVATTAGVESGSEVRVHWDPTYERLTFHRIVIHRGGRELDALDPSQVRVLQQESDLDAQIYDGSLTAVVFLKDVRAGDVIDAAWTTTGENPVFDGRFAAREPLGSGSKVERLRVRLVAPKELAVDARVSGLDVTPTERLVGGDRERVWNLEPSRATEFEPDAPGWYEEQPTLQLSTFHTWAELVAWAVPLFSPPAGASPELDRRVLALRASGDDEARLLAAVKFVQDDVRYLGIEMGRNSHEPHPPAQVLAQRFGDCKDKSFLLATLLGRLGFEANVALVNTRATKGLDHFLPSPFDFDHAIVRARVGGRDVWIDGTAAYERGRLAVRTPPPFARALVVAPGTTGLVEIPRVAPTEPTTVTERTFTLGEHGRPTELVVKGTLRGEDANGFRYRRAHTPEAELGKSALDYYERLFSKVREKAPAEIEDDEQANVIVVTRRYEIADFAPDREWDFFPDTLRDVLEKLPQRARTAPVAVEDPYFAEQITRVVGPVEIDFDPRAGTIDDAALTFSWDFHRVDSGVELRWTARSLADSVPAKDVEEHAAKVEKMREKSECDLRWDGDARLGARGASKADGYVLLGLVGLVALFVGVRSGPGAWRSWRRRRAWKKRSRAGAGDLPTEPLTCQNLAELRRTLEKLRCACGGELEAQPRATDDAMRVGERTVVAFRFVCAECGVARRTYVALPEDLAAD